MCNNFLIRKCYSYGGKLSLNDAIDLVRVSKEDLQNLGVESLEVYLNDQINLLILEADAEAGYMTETPGGVSLESMTGRKGFNELKRIFKKESSHPEKEYYLVRKMENFKRFVMTLELENNDELVREYIEIHTKDNIWPQVISNMNHVGVYDMELYLNKYQAFLIMETSMKFSWEKDGPRWAELPKEKQWQEFVSRFQKVNPEDKAAEKWKLMLQKIQLVHHGS